MKLLPFDGAAPWGDPRIGTGYDLDVYPGEDGWLPHIEIEPARDEYNLTYHFIRSFDAVGVYTPGYAIPDPAFGIFSLPDELPVPTWMPAAIERAGFGYDPTSNSERRAARKADAVSLPRGQQTLTEEVGTA